jgi:shikimate kinase
MSKALYMLIGPKGSGKTHIGTLVEKRTDISFLRVEPIWLSLRPHEDGWNKVEEAIDKAFDDYSGLMIESLGAGQEFQRFHDSLTKKYDVKMIRVIADLEVCLQRVRNRDNREHIPVPDAKVEQYNKIASQVQFDWSLEIDNNGPASPDEILAAIKCL